MKGIYCLMVMLFFTTVIYAQTAEISFAKDFTVNNTNTPQLTDNNNEPLKSSHMYAIKLITLGTGTNNGAEYLAWYQASDSTWRIRYVAVSGTNSNHPKLFVDNNIVKLRTEHTRSYNIRAIVKDINAGVPSVLPYMMGASYQWQRNSTSLSYIDGNVGIGTATPSEKLSVNGNIRAKEIKVETANWPDYVFAKDYQLQPLTEVEAFINKNQHLPGLPNKEAVAAEGVNLGEMNRKLLEKVEELTLHIIRLEKELHAVTKTNQTH